MIGHLDDWIAETSDSISARLEGAREAQRQTRFTLGMMAVISMMMLILSYNAYLSFDSKWILSRALKRDSPFFSVDGAETVADLLTNQAIQDWASSRNATIELLGIRVSVDDVPVLGTISLFVFSLWLLLVTRRENHTIGSLLRDTDTSRDDESDRDPAVSERQIAYSNGQRWLIFHTIAANNLFVTFRSFNVAYSVVTRCKPPPEHEYKKHEGDFEQTRTYIRSRFLLLVSCCSFRLRFLP